jgi:hypothetical protein
MSSRAMSLMWEVPLARPNVLFYCNTVIWSFQHNRHKVLGKIFTVSIRIGATNARDDVGTSRHSKDVGQTLSVCGGWGCVWVGQKERNQVQSGDNLPGYVIFTLEGVDKYLIWQISGLLLSTMISHWPGVFVTPFVPEFCQYVLFCEIVFPHRSSKTSRDVN